MPRRADRHRRGRLSLRAKQAVHPFAIEVIAFGDEEGVRFTSALGGSRALAGTFDPAILDERDEEGVSRRQALVAFGCNPDAIAAEARSAATALGYVEVHIEQGPVLEAEDLPVGIVTAISGATRGYSSRFTASPATPARCPCMDDAMRWRRQPR